MLTVEETRRLIGDASITDQEAEEIRDSLRILAEIIFEQWLAERKIKLPQK